MSDGHRMIWRVSSMRAVVAVLTMFVLAAYAARDAQAEPLKATIVGLGAATCQQFNDDARSNPPIQRDYLAWAQGFMSGILSSRPPGVDEGLDLSPPTFPAARQLDFLGDYCARNSSIDFSDGVAALYKRLRQEGKK
ncbi:hypothetical protein JQ554_15155 [Bradyrhizobium diazoefficiens]|nr:hypothetical protein [Bradyrhizobium diazoefficiens]MBR0979322.1 hypothetical protein [Bradyrhizobium diazoefficiens]MBR1008714.1 hypothetical protein [Bradyrhizobium diazoefficiens]MBR1014737.1 hypothetical protein [Bradyrhizobium diazoefficiens]MBR1052675.1 hypothetical protein [Bradyrhizobium diazoefficiens]